MNLPTEFKGTIYFYYWMPKGLSITIIHVSTYRKDEDPEYVLLGTLEVDMEFNTSHEDAVKQMVDALKKEKADVQAKAQHEIDRIDSRINELLVITYQEGES